MVTIDYGPEDPRRLRARRHQPRGAVPRPPPGLDSAPDERDAVILTALGSPDPDGREVDGLGGGTSSLSKAAIISPSNLSDVDVEFEFAQVDVERPFVDWSGTCGNISSAVGPFAIDEGLVNAMEPETQVRVLAANTGKRFVAACR